MVIGNKLIHSKPPNFIFTTTALKLFSYYFFINQMKQIANINKNSHQKCSVKKGIPKIVANVTGKHLC